MNEYMMFLRLPAGVEQIRESALIPAQIGRLVYQHIPLANMVRREIGRQPFVIVSTFSTTDAALRALAAAYRAAVRDEPVRLITVPCTMELI